MDSGVRCRLWLSAFTERNRLDYSCFTYGPRLVRHVMEL